jgi:hypothetical protein
MRLAELFLDAGAQVIALDWVGIWWSLRLAADGKGVGFPNVYIFGGEHADVDLRPESGALMADLVVDKHISVVLDVMHFRKAERTRFATAFAEQFFHRKKTARSACHLFIEEAQAYLPQMVRGDEARMVGVFEDIGKVGRNYGIGNSLISQRPQAINKDVSEPNRGPARVPDERTAGAESDRRVDRGEHERRRHDDSGTAEAACR